MASNSLTTIIAGMPCTGKSSISRELKKRDSLAVLDLDDEIENKLGRLVTDIIRVDGIGKFREIESTVLRECLEAKPDFLSLGGGALTVVENVLAIKDARALLISLSAPLSVLVGRAIQDEGLQGVAPKRPLLFSGLTDRTTVRSKIIKLIAERWRYFEQADFIVCSAYADASVLSERIFYLSRYSQKSEPAVLLPVSGRSCFRFFESRLSDSIMGEGLDIDLIAERLMDFSNAEGEGPEFLDFALRISEKYIQSLSGNFLEWCDYFDNGPKANLFSAWPAIEEAIYVKASPSIRF